MAVTLTPKARARWVWLTGMMVVSPHLGRYRLTEANQTRPTQDCAPDLTDEVTAACLPLVVRAVWKAPKSSVWYCPLARRWELNVQTATRLYVGDTEAEAWIAALEAAP